MELLHATVFLPPVNFYDDLFVLPTFLLLGSEISPLDLKYPEGEHDLISLLYTTETKATVYTQ